MDMDSVTYAYISEPVEFRQLEGRAIDFRKTFDVRGRGTDEMLQLYLRKAHLPDDIEDMPAMQRRAYVYDIIRSNKGPGYWVPPSLQVSSDIFSQPPPAVLPPPTTGSTPHGSPKMSHAKSTNSMDSLASTSSAMPGPSFATSVVVSNKGSKYEISGPINFQHVSGDVTRDRTRNAFDLNGGANDNVLKKYMMEHGITQADVAGMRRQDLIAKIVHSNFTWLPNKKQAQKDRPKSPPLLYATISTNNQITPPSSPPPAARRPEPASLVAAAPPASGVYSNYASVTSRFVDISDLELPQMQPVRQEVGTVVPVQIQQRPQHSRPNVPPPPSAVMAANTRAYPAPIEIRPPAPKIANETYATIAPQTHRKTGTMRVAPPAPPKPTILPNSATDSSSVQYVPVKQPPPPPPIKVSALQTRNPPTQITPKPKTTAISSNGSVPPPPPPPPMIAVHVDSPPPMSAAAGGRSKPITAVQGGVPPPPPPPPPPALATGVPMPPPPPPTDAATLSLANKKSEQPKPTTAAGDNRDAFLASIRNGVTLKKVDQKAATISGIKPRAEKKPATTDFLSELKLGITLRRVKNPADNPFSEANTDESQA